MVPVFPTGAASNPRDFELKTYDLSNLSGQSLKARFSFFSTPTSKATVVH